MQDTKLKLPIRREQPAVRRAEIIEAALRLAARVGAQGLIRDRIAEEAGVCSSLLHRHCGSMDSLREIIIAEAFKREDTEVLYKSLSVEDFRKLNTNPRLTEKLCQYMRAD